MRRDRRHRRLLTIVLVLAATLIFGLPAGNPASPEYVAAVLADQPWGYWKLDEVSGSVAGDTSVNDRPLNVRTRAWATIPLWGRPGPFEDAMALELRGNPNGYEPGDTAIRTLGGNEQPLFIDDFTAEVWVRPAVSGYQFLVGAGNPIRYGSNGWGLLKDGTDRLVLWVSGQQVLTGPVLPLAAWTHLAVTRDAGVWHLYRDGVEVASAGSTDPLPPGDFYIGADAWGGGGLNFKGLVAHGAFYAHVLTPARVSAHFQAASQTAQLLLTLTSDPPEIAVGSYRAVSATFTGGAVPVGTAVDFTITGANPTTGRAFTGEQGRAELVYGAAVEGADEIRALASVSGASIEASPLSVSASVPPLPIVSESRYVISLETSRFRAFGSFAGKSGAFGPVVLSFGQPNARGTRLVGGEQFVRSYDRIVRMLQEFSNAYHRAWHGSPGGNILIVVGVNNDMPPAWNENLGLASEAGADFARAVKRFQAWVAGSHTDPQGGTVRYTRQTVAAGIDLEQAFPFSRYDVTKSFLDGYNSVAGHPRLLNYGALTIDPACGASTDPPCAHAGRDWSAQRVLNLSRLPYSAFICPQVYTSTQINYWIALQRAAVSGALGGPPMYVKCLFNSDSPFDSDSPPKEPYYRPAESWTTFWSRLALALRGDWTEQHATHTKTVTAS